MSQFQQRKDRILQELSTNDETHKDASPKGTVDAGIRAFVDEINKLDGYVTTSSCAGRVAIYEEGGSSSIDALPLNEGTSILKTGSKGSGRWHFVSHDPIADIEHKSDTEISRLLKLAIQDTEEVPYQPGGRLIHFKFEPMILHILCSSLTNAKHVLAAAMSAGFRESGIGAISDELDRIMVAVRTTGLGLDTTIATVRNDGGMHLLVSSQHIRMLLQLANSRFAINKQRTDRFRDALLALQHAAEVPERPDWEPAVERKARLRAEGLERQHRLRSQKQSHRAESPNHGATGREAMDLITLLDEP